MSINFNPFPEITTERLILRRITREDVKDLFVLRADKEIMKYIPRPLAKVDDDVVQLIQRIDDGINNNESINWAIALKSDSKLIGTIGFVRMNKENFRAEVGYLLHPGFQGMGIMKEALPAVIDYGFNEMKLHSIEAIIDPENIASEKLLKSNKFIKEAHFKENCFYEGKFFDSIHYSILSPLK